MLAILVILFRRDVTRARTTVSSGRSSFRTKRERPGLVRDAMTFIWAARRGLAETELLDLLGKDGEPLPGAYWVPFHLAAETA